MLNRLKLQLRALFRRGTMEGELDEELSYHVEKDIQRHIARGMSMEDAKRAARRGFGNVETLKEESRDARGTRWLEDLAQDVRYVIRALRKSPGFTMTAVATLTLAIGANTAMFSVLNAVVLQPLPYQSPEQLAMLWAEDPTQNLREVRASDLEVDEWRRQSESFVDMAVFDSMGVTLTEAEGAERIGGASISPNLLPLLGVQPVRGRSFSAEEAEQQQRLVLISHRFWQTRLGGTPDAIGASIVLDGRPSQIIGILPAGFHIARFDADVWWAHAMPKEGDIRRSMRGGDTQAWFVVGRLRPNVTFDQAQAEMSAIARRLADQLPAADRNRGISVVPLSLQLLDSRSRLALWILGGAVLCVLLIAAANVASLSLARSIGRAREMVVRAALGASAGRIVRQLLTESVVLAAISGLIGTLLAVAGIRLLRTFGPPNLPRLNEVSLDLRVLGWALAISLLTGILVGLAPAITTSRRNLRPSGEGGGRSVSAGVAARGIRRALVVAEFALAIVLLVGAGLLVRSWWHVESVDPGFRPERVLAMELASPRAFSALAQRADLYHRVLEQIQVVPGVERAGIAGDLFISNTREHVFTAEGDEGSVSGRLRSSRDEVSPGFFEAIGTPLLRGRFFTVADGPDAPRVAIVNEAMAHRIWPGQDPLGRRLKLGAAEADRPWMTVVGVVADMRRQGLEREPVPQMFESLAQNPPQAVDLFIRTSRDDPLSLAAALQAAVRGVEKHAPIYGVTTLGDQLGTYLTQRRFQTSLLTGFSIVALLMAAVGIYGLIQYSVAARTREIGLRMALGAKGRDIFRMIIGEGLTLSLTGLVLGLVGALWVGQAASSLLFGVTATDPLTFMTVSLLLTAVAIAACYFPARRAMRAEPVVALREE